jgi:hypothetical protein
MRRRAPQHLRNLTASAARTRERDGQSRHLEDCSAMKWTYETLNAGDDVAHGHSEQRLAAFLTAVVGPTCQINVCMLHPCEIRSQLRCFNVMAPMKHDKDRYRSSVTEL